MEEIGTSTADLLDRIWAESQERIVSGIKSNDVVALLGAARLMLRTYRKHGRLPDQRDMCRQMQRRVPITTFRELRSRIQELVAEAKDAAVQIVPIPFEGRISRSRREFRVAEYARQWEDVCRRYGRNPMGEDEKCRKGAAKQPIMCVSKMLIFESVTEAAKWLNKEGYIKVIPAHLRTAVTNNRKCCQMSWRYVEEAQAAQIPATEFTSVAVA